MRLIIFLNIYSWDSVVFRGLHGSLSAPVTRSSVNADSHYAYANDIFNVAFRWRKPFSNR